MDRFCDASIVGLYRSSYICFRSDNCNPIGELFVASLIIERLHAVSREKELRASSIVARVVVVHRIVCVLSVVCVNIQGYIPHVHVIILASGRSPLKLVGKPDARVCPELIFQSTC